MPMTLPPWARTPSAKACTSSGEVSRMSWPMTTVPRPWSTPVSTANASPSARVRTGSSCSGERPRTSYALTTCSRRGSITGRASRVVGSAVRREPVPGDVRPRGPHRPAREDRRGSARQQPGREPGGARSTPAGRTSAANASRRGRTYGVRHRSRADPGQRSDRHIRTSRSLLLSVSTLTACIVELFPPGEVSPATARCALGSPHESRYRWWRSLPMARRRERTSARSHA